ncbi:hypothetical protein A3F08_01780 [Candidatus Berkelbacteria bacterium RIFCSPHIGHO2_12_FULL_36_9]|uniref:Nucleotidyltransferase n=1 Tax=Candidatus Berkelbacteria bacterium RIFCSPHIGHO2_12_FULL_36_9 TaxID=1797469 RepID=A0A1F5ED53_9BACT|nr:MAG: hypothetical protein A3F08_01780 [Candidatus Berkelbacteria bacterium RIFCSPHIGHO2_12_FULL_36_9]
MFEETLSKKTHDLLAALSKNELIKKAYLAGDTALALQLGHRISVDLDFFTNAKFSVDSTINSLNKISKFTLERRDWQTIIGYFEKIKFSLFYYEHKLISKPIDYQGIKLAHIKDIAAMKINAVADRGLKRDFIDLYFIMQTDLDLKHIIELYDKKYAKLKINKLHILKSLTYFVDADDEKMPKMLKDVSW